MIMPTNNSVASARIGMRSIYRMSDAQPNWAQDDPSQPDYIKNKELAEKLRPVSVDGQEILDDSYDSGRLNLVSGENVELSTNGKSVVISAKSQPDKLRPIFVDGQEILDADNSGGLNLVGGNNVTLKVSGNSVMISSSGSGSGGGESTEYIGGEGIDITEDDFGRKLISIEPGAISSDMIESISFEKITQSDGIKLILNGGNANG